ncbi:SDR family NAD(P)-dependent oxidoreductase [Streptomyces sp. H10-C2]|uniref:SDR family NAD(P)-dependent oxidoreductase n=1 Tax=unclassified Streptomyces TaxID=2593676 RepID=UPI0024BA2B1D|nr:MULTISPECIES: SDR family NAD(P)-dependent oxidoreductase [unclassified Streptomyces]MDJ0343349.1 SDR family NAD(P)-dependent oxidoreductase [Streptomyces sp. PH10-H1]MDJ0371840.1 SDR family NAD(P)-dependent oxidoreductase [Streptomyces sp. H10-C2]
MIRPPATSMVSPVSQEAAFPVHGSYPDLAGKVVVVTGGSRGIGARTAQAFAGQGAAVCVVGRDEDALAGVVAGITATGGTAIGAVADVTDSAALDPAAAPSENTGARNSALTSSRQGQPRAARRPVEPALRPGARPPRAVPCRARCVPGAVTRVSSTGWSARPV